MQRSRLSEWPCKDVNTHYEWCKDVNQGTYGYIQFNSAVYKARQKSSNEIVALKKIKQDVEKDGVLSKCQFPITGLREISILQQLNHPNIIKIKDIVTAQFQEQISTYLVFDYYEHDFECLINNKVIFTLPQIKNIIYQLLEGLTYSHSQKILHRDLKSANILYKNNGTIVLADFGLAKRMNNRFTTKVVTLWYRAPELLLGASRYDYRVDMWSVGCFLYELLSGQVPFKGINEKDQMEKISEICGSELWPEAYNYKYTSELAPQQKSPYQLRNHIFQMLLNKNYERDSSTLDFLEQLLSVNPDKRLTSEQALKHSFFTSEPHICKKSEMPLLDQKDLHGKSKLRPPIESQNLEPKIQKTIIKSNKYAQHLIQKRSEGFDPSIFGQKKL